MSIRIEVIDTIEAFKDLEKDWNQLYSQDLEATIFISWDWMFTWWETFNNSIKSQLFILCVYENKELIGIAPFYLLHSFPKSLIQGKTITFIGSGENCKDKIVSQYSDFLVNANKKAEVVKSISDFLISNKNKWDFADFEFLLKDSLISTFFEDGLSDIHINSSHYGNRFFISEIKDMDDFLNQMGNRWSKMFRKKYQKLQNQGEVEIISTQNTDATQKEFKQLAKMHEARWKGRTDFNIFKSKLFNDFHMKIMERLVPKDKAFIKTLSLNGEPLSSYYCFKDKSQIHYYQSGFYSENANKYSPLFLLVCKEIGVAIKNDCLFDFMFDEDHSSYKKEQYAAQCEPMYRIMWSHKKTRIKHHGYAKIIQTKYLSFKHSLSKTNKNNN